MRGESPSVMVGTDMQEGEVVLTGSLADDDREGDRDGDRDDEREGDSDDLLYAELAEGSDDGE